MKSWRDFFKYRVFTVPMRNWNYVKFALILFRYEFLQYLWGIETQDWRWNSTKRKSFYSTYEELKRVIKLFCKVSCHTFLQYLWGIETFFLPKFSRSGTTVFTVPMRNWNYSCGFSGSSQGNVFTVPMRNWNAAALLRMN